MPLDRKGGRNVFIYNGSTGVSLGGMHQNGSITEAVFLWMLRYVLLSADGELRVIARTTQQSISSTNRPLEPGDYDVYSSGILYTQMYICMVFY